MHMHSHVYSKWYHRYNVNLDSLRFFCDVQNKGAAVARFTTISCLHLNERGGAIPGDIRQLRVELFLTGAPTPAKNS